MTSALLHQALLTQDASGVRRAMEEGAHPLDRTPTGVNAWEALLGSEESLRRLGGMGPENNDFRSALSDLAQVGPRTFDDAVSGYPTHRQAIALSTFHREVAVARRSTGGIDPLAETLTLGSRFVRSLTEINTMKLGFKYEPEQAQALIAQAKRGLTFQGSQAEAQVSALAQAFVQGRADYSHVVTASRALAAPESQAFASRALAAEADLGPVVFATLESRRQRLAASAPVPDASRPRPNGPSLG